MGNRVRIPPPQSAGRRAAKSQTYAQELDEPVSWVRSRGTHIRIAIAVALLGLYFFDALLWSSKGVRLACSALPQGWEENLPCPASKQASLPKADPKQTSSDPRRELKDGMGIVWSEENFWKAVARGDERATALFLRDGMTISSQHLHALLSDTLGVTRAALHQLVELGRTRNAEFCSSNDDAGPSTKPVAAHRTVVRFADYAKDERVAQFVRDFCAGPAIVEALSRHLAAESMRVTNAEQTNARNQKSQSACHSRFLTDQAVARYQDMRRGAAPHACDREDIKDDLERGLCLHQFPIVQQTNAYGNVLASAVDYEAGVREFCSKAFTVKSFDRTKRDELGIAIAVFAK